MYFLPQLNSQCDLLYTVAILCCLVLLSTIYKPAIHYRTMSIGCLSMCWKMCLGDAEGKMLIWCYVFVQYSNFFERSSTFHYLSFVVFHFVFPPQTKFQGYIWIRLSCLCVNMSCKRNSSLNEPILLKLYTVAVYNLRMCMRIIPVQSITTEIIICTRHWVSYCELTDSSCLVYFQLCELSR